MADNTLFDILVEYHGKHNLASCAPSFSHGKYYSPFNHKPIEETMENEQTKGVLILANGDTLISRLTQDKVIIDKGKKEFLPARTSEDIECIFDRYNTKDGAFVYDGIHSTMARVARFSNQNAKLERVREHQSSLIPKDFIKYNGTSVTEEDIEEDIGTKTDLAMCTSQAYTESGCVVHTYQIKRQAYTDLGLGKVTHFGPEGLEEEFFFKYEPTNPKADTTHGIIGVYRRYEKQEGGLQKVEEKTVDVRKYLPHTMTWRQSLMESLRRLVPANLG